MDLYGTPPAADLDNADGASALLTVCYCFFVIGVVDIGVAYSLYSWLDTSSHSLALVSSWLRLAYTIQTLSATSNLIVALACLHHNDAAGMYSAMLQFEFAWNVVALAVFGLHLIVLGFAVASIAPRQATRMLYRVGDGAWSSAGVYLLALLLVVAGAGYIADSWAVVLHLPTRSPIQLSANGTAVGEIVLMLWLLAKYARREPQDGRLALA